MTSSRPSARSAPKTINPEVVEGLTHLGLSAYEVRVYSAILGHPRSRVPEIARYSAVPQPKVYATIKRLIERGLVESHLGPINQYSALDPGEAFANLLDHSMERQREANHAVELLSTLYAQATQGLSRREGRIKLFQGRAATARNFKELSASAEKEIAVIARLPLLARDDDDTVRDRLKAGVRLRTLVEIASDDVVPEDWRSLERSRDSGAEVRRISHVPMRMGVFDRRITILPMFDPVVGQGDGVGMLEIRNNGLSESFLEFYELLWNRAEPF